MYSIPGYERVFGPPSPLTRYGGVSGPPSPLTRYGGVSGPPYQEAHMNTGYGGPPQVQIVFGRGFGVDAGTIDKSGMYNEETVKAREEDAGIRAAAFHTDVFAPAMPMQPTLYNPPPMSPSTALPAARSDTASTCMPISETPSLSCPSLSHSL